MKSSLIALLAVATAGMFTLASCGDPTVEPATNPTDPGTPTIDTNPPNPTPGVLSSMYRPAPPIKSSSHARLGLASASSSRSAQPGSTTANVSSRP